MDDYLDCLYLHFLETRLNELLRSSEVHRLLSQRRDAAWEALTARLSPEQTAALDAFFAASTEAFAAESWLLFQEAVGLGKWMAR